MGVITTWYHEVEHLMPATDPKTRDWFLVDGSPEGIILITVVYVLTVKLGQRLMRNREPFSLQGFLIMYNLVLVALSFYLFVELVISVYESDYTIQCSAYNEHTLDNPKNIRVARVMWVYFMSKPIELLDTYLMVVRKKNNQVTFLHVFHHSSMMYICWVTLMFVPGGDNYVGAVLNSFVHVVMYAYYGLSVIPALRPYLWWKRYITRMQLVQFVCVFTTSAVSIIFGCDFPDWNNVFNCSYMVFLTILFSNFYFHTYISKSRSRSQPDTNGSVANNNKDSHLYDKVTHSTNGVNGVYEKKVK